MVRGKDACWEHCSLVDATRQKVRCNYCRREFSGGVYRMKFHLAQIKNKDIVPCTEVPDEVRDTVLRVLSTSKKYKTSKKQDSDQEMNGLQDSSSASGGLHPDAIANRQHEIPCPSPSHPSLSMKPTIDDSGQQRCAKADKKVALFFFHNSIHFNATKSIYYQAMVDAIAECGIGYKAPTCDKLRSVLLEDVKGEMAENYKRLRDDWREVGCSILCESWSDGGSSSFLVFSVASTKGTLFLKSVDVSSRADDAYYLFELFDSIIIEIGPENVVQIVTDNAANYVHAAGLVLKKHSSLFWSPCASHCVNEMLDDISKQEPFSRALEEGRSIAQYLHSDHCISNMMKKFTGGIELIRPKITRALTNFLSLKSVMMQQDNLKHMFTHADWLLSINSKRPDAQAAKSLLFSEQFWVSAREAVNILEPLVKVLRIVEGDMPAMGYIYEGIEKAKLSIKNYYRGCEHRYVLIMEIIDRRWSTQHLQLNAAAAFLNPSVFHSSCFKFDSNMRNGFHAAMWKMFPLEKDRIEVAKEHPVYVNAQGAMGNDFSILGRTLNTPGDWWAAYGYEVPTLQRAAIRILNQPCSLHWCRWNWGMFASSHSKKHCGTEQQKFKDLVFLHCNLHLQAINRSRNTKCTPIVFDEIDVSLEWPREADSASRLLDDTWLDNLPIECQGSS